MTKNDHKWMPLFSASLQPVFDEHRAYALILSFGNNSHRRQSDANQIPFACFNSHLAKENVADDAAIVFGNQRDRRLAVLPQRVNQISFSHASERPLVDDSDRGDVFRLFMSNGHHSYFFSSSFAIASRWTSSGPSARRSVRWCAQALARWKS